MPASRTNLTAPGVSIEELPTTPSLVEPPTAELGLVAWFGRGPVGEPVTVTSAGEAARLLGDDDRGEGGWALRQFFTNGGRVAHVVRVAPGAQPATTVLADEGGGVPLLRIEAIDPGAWGDAVRVTVVPDPDDDTAFTLRVEEVGEAADGTPSLRVVEAFPGCTTAADGSGVASVTRGSQLVDVSVLPAATGQRPASGTSALSGGEDGDAPGSSTWSAVAVEMLLGAPAGVGCGAAPATGLEALAAMPDGPPPLLLVPDGSALPEPSHAALTDRCAAFCREQQVFQLVDPPATRTGVSDVVAWATARPMDRSAAAYHPRLAIPLPGGSGRVREVGPGATIAGIIARTDATRGVWKAPAGMEAAVWGATVTEQLGPSDVEDLSLAGVDPIRATPQGTLVWGARTMAGRRGGNAEDRYVPVRRTLLTLERTLDRGLRWVVFEPNDEALWTTVRRTVETYLDGWWRQGAMVGETPSEAYRVACGLGTTMTANDILDGRLLLQVQVALLRPAEFIVLQQEFRMAAAG